MKPSIRAALDLKYKQERQMNELIGELIMEHIGSKPVDQRTDVHTEHCCVVHGCKYRDDNCTVETEQLVQSYPCESCDEYVNTEVVDPPDWRP